MIPWKLPIYIQSWFNISLFISKWMFHGFPDNVQRIVTGIIFVLIPLLIVVEVIRTIGSILKID